MNSDICLPQNKLVLVHSNGTYLIYLNFPTINSPIISPFLWKKQHFKNNFYLCIYFLCFTQSLVIMCLMWTILLTHGLLLVSSGLVSGVAVSLKDGLSQGRMKQVHVEKKHSMSPVQRHRRVLTGLTFIDCSSSPFFSSPFYFLLPFSLQDKDSNLSAVAVPPTDHQCANKSLPNRRFIKDQKVSITKQIKHALILTYRSNSITAKFKLLDG